MLFLVFIPFATSPGIFSIPFPQIPHTHISSGGGTHP